MRCNIIQIEMRETKKPKRNLKKSEKHTERFRTHKNDNNMICLVLLEQEEIHFEVEDDFKEKIFQIYFHHFLVGVFQGIQEEEDHENKKEKILNMIYT